MKQSRQENLIYLVVWGLLFAAPLLSLYVRTAGSNMAFDWTEVLFVWRKFAVFLLVFLVHNYLIAPLLIHRQRRILYLSVMAALTAGFVAYQCSRPNRMEHRGPRPPQMEHRMEHHDMPRRAVPMEGRRMPPPFIGEREILTVAMLFLMIGANLGIKYYFRSRDDRIRLAELERQNMEQQLEYLRYQINPHFFMNTLNNIHALVDIDPEKAKDTILELSKMMRFVLYEGNKQGVPLSRELDFIRHYIALMQLRYTDKVRITVDLPSGVPDCQMPPLILITFIENAFKHGISYQRESFIEVRVAVEGNELRFVCRNSKAEKSNEERGGVGLANVRKRLNLLYRHDYSLRIHDVADAYSVELTIPLLYDTLSRYR